jgi:hypothetical protein
MRVVDVEGSNQAVSPRTRTVNVEPGAPRLDALEEGELPPTQPATPTTNSTAAAARDDIDMRPPPVSAGFARMQSGTVHDPAPGRGDECNCCTQCRLGDAGESMEIPA